MKDGITTLRSGKSLLFVSILNDKSTDSKIVPTVKKIIQKEKKTNRVNMKKKPLDLQFIATSFYNMEPDSPFAVNKSLEIIDDTLEGDSAEDTRRKPFLKYKSAMITPKDKKQKNDILKMNQMQMQMTPELNDSICTKEIPEDMFTTGGDNTI